MTQPHQGQPIRAAGAPLAQARAAMIMVHGRGATAESILELASLLDQNDFAYLAPQAANYTWYPYSFLSPIAQNEPGLSSGLALLESLLDHLDESGLPSERVILLGFSQGACLSTEYVARQPRRYGGVAGLSGGLIGPPGTQWGAAEATNASPLAGTPVFLGCSDIDPHIPLERVKETTAALRAMGAEVTERIYPRMGHTVNEDEIDFVRGMMAKL